MGEDTKDKLEDEWAAVDAEQAEILASAPVEMRTQVRTMISALYATGRVIEKTINAYSENCTCGKHHDSEGCTPDDAMAISAAVYSLVNRLGAKLTAETLTGIVKDMNARTKTKKRIPRTGPRGPRAWRR